MFLYKWDKKGKNMSELVIKTAKENGDLPEDFDGHSVEKLHKVIDRKIKILEDSNKLQEYYKRQTILHQWVGRPLPEKEKV